MPRSSLETTRREATTIPREPMTTLHLLSHAEPLLTAASRLYALGGEVFTITTLLWGLRLLSGLIETTYNAGLIAGKFYKLHLHKWTVRAAAFYWLGCVLTWQGLRWCYEHRAEILASLNSFRHEIEALFVYRSPAPVLEGY